MTAHPNGISSGVWLSGHIFVTVAAVTPTVTIPVGIMIGDMQGQVNSPFYFRVQLPIVHL